MFELEYAKSLDATDNFRTCKDEFNMIEGKYYMDGNSLGLFPKRAEATLHKMLNNYKRLGIDLWSQVEPPVFLYQNTLAKKMAPIVGAKANELTIHANTTVNIFSMVATLYQPTEKRRKIIIDNLNFPTGRYTIESLLRLKGLNPSDIFIEIESEDGLLLDESKIIDAMTEEVAMVFLPSVLYRSGQLIDMQRLSLIGRERNIIVGFDCSHSAGSVIHKFDEWQTDFAVWCTYKYLNCGPGANAALFLNERHHKMPVGIQGWQGYVKDKQFDLLNEFENVKDASGWQTGTQNILSMAPIEGALELFELYGMETIRAKSLRLTSYLSALIKEVLTPYGFSVGTPSQDERRGGHIALLHSDAVRINEALKANGVVPDFRAPNVIRLAPVAFYITFEDIYNVVRIIKEIMDQKQYEQFDSKRGTVA